MMESKDPVFGLVAIFGKNNAPIMIRNYLVEELRQNQTKNLMMEGDLVSLDLQMNMLAYSSLDVFEER